MHTKTCGSAEDNFITLLNFIADPAIIIDEKGCFLVVNDAFTDLTGLTKKELVGKAFLGLDILNAETKTMLFENLKKRMKGANVEPYEFSFKNQVGATRYVEVKAKRVKYSGHPADLVVFHDITRRKENARRLKEYSEKMAALVDEKAREIKEGKEKLETVFDSSPDAIVVTDLEGKFVEVNEATVHLYEYSSKEELIGKSTLDLIPQEERQNFLRMFETLAEVGAVKNVEYVCLTKQNRVFPVEFSASYLKDSSGNPTGFMGVIKDISERKKAQAKILASERKYRKLFKELKLADKQLLDEKNRVKNYLDIAEVMLVALDTKGYITMLNRKGCEILQCREEEALGKNWFDNFVPPTKRADVKNYFSLMVSEKVDFPKYYENPVLAKNGGIRLVGWHNTILRNDSGRIIGTLSSGEDITQRKKAEAKLSESEDKYRTLVEQSLQGILIGQFAPFRFVFANQPAVKLLGYTVDELKALSPEEIKRLVHPDDVSSILRRFRSGLLEKKVPQRFDFRMIKKNRKVCWVEAFCAITHYAGEPAVQIIFVDITERMRLENSLRTSEEMFRAISTSAIDAIILLDDRGKIRYWNPAAERSFGYTNKEAVGKTLDALIIPPKYQGLHSKSVLKSFKNGQKHRNSMEFKALRKNGTEVPIELSVSVLKIKDKKHMLGIIRDTSERKKMEMTLREAEKRYHALFDKAPLGILVVDETATAVEFNDEAHRQLGYTREEFAKLKIYDYEVIETPEETKARMKKVMREGKDEFETKHRTKNGEIRDVINAVQVIELAGKKFFHLITRDITEQKKIERELKIEKDKLDAVTENIGAGLGIISKDYRILWANKLLKEINGECEGKKCYTTFNRITDVCPDCGVKKIFKGGVPIDIHEYSNVNNKGDRYWIELIVTPIKDEKGNIIAALELAVNITERKIMQNKLAEYSQKLEKLVNKRTKQLKLAQAKLVKSERLATIGELAAMVGHDLRNPLTGIMGAAYYLKTKHTPELGAKAKEMLETIENAIIYSNKIVNDLLEYSRDLKLELTETTPKELLKTALSLTEIPQGIHVVDATEDKPTVKADAEKLRRVFVNIIRNAFDAMPDGGILTVKSMNVKGKLEVSFKDTGTGMSKETLSKLKGGVPLFTTKAKGMGFGVPICKRIVEAHGGELLVESKVGKGTTITITVPVKPKFVDENQDVWIFNESMIETVKVRNKTK
jgi:PAS domain S-box-containing protein